MAALSRYTRGCPFTVLAQYREVFPDADHVQRGRNAAGVAPRDSAGLLEVMARSRVGLSRQTDFRKRLGPGNLAVVPRVTVSIISRTKAWTRNWLAVSAIQSPAPQVEQGVGVQVAGGGPVPALHVIGIDQQAGFTVNLGVLGQQRDSCQSGGP